MVQAIKFVFDEHISNLKLIKKMAMVNMRKQTLRTSLGVLWLYIHDFVYFAVFMLFRILMAGNGNIDGMHTVVFLVTGLIPWFFISEVLNVVASSIKNNKAIITSIRFPITVLPMVELLGIFFKRIWTFGFIFFGAIYYGYGPDINIVLFLYYTFAMFMLMFSIMLVISAFIAVSSDFLQLYLVTIRVLLYTMPIVWGFKHIMKNPVLCKAVKLNPMVYVLNGYRSAFVYGNMPSLVYSAYFWGFVLVCLAIGCFVQFKLRRYYSDFM